MSSKLQGQPHPQNYEDKYVLKIIRTKLSSKYSKYENNDKMSLSYEDKNILKITIYEDKNVLEITNQQYSQNYEDPKIITEGQKCSLRGHLYFVLVILRTIYFLSL